MNFISAGIGSLKANYEDIVALRHKYRGLKENENTEEAFIEIEIFEQEIELRKRNTRWLFQQNPAFMRCYPEAAYRLA